MNKITFKSHWNKYNLSQQPQWPNKDDYLEVIKKLSLYPKLVNTNEILLLKDELKLMSYRLQWDVTVFLLLDNLLFNLVCPLTHQIKVI